MRAMVIDTKNAWCSRKDLSESCSHRSKWPLCRRIGASDTRQTVNLVFEARYECALVLRVQSIVDQGTEL